MSWDLTIILLFRTTQPIKPSILMARGSGARRRQVPTHPTDGVEDTWSLYREERHLEHATSQENGCACHKCSYAAGPAQALP